MNEEFWLDRWKSDHIGFHQEDVNASLIEHFPRMLWREGGRIFVPLCGKSEDMIWLRDHGQEVVGLELSSIACRAFFDEHDEEYELREAGRFRLYVGDELEIFCGDYFLMGPEKLGEVDGVYDRAALVALPPERRPEYVEQMRRLVPGGVTVLLLTMEYDPSRMDGPPFSVPEEEVRNLYGEAFEVEQLAVSDWHEAPEHLAQRGLDRIREVSWMLTRNED